VSFVLFGIVVYATPAIDRDVLYRPGMALVLGVFGAIVAGYLFRERRIIVYYLMDAWPAIAVVTGVLAVVAYRQATQRWRVVMLTAMGIGFVVSTALAVPLVGVVFGTSPGWFTMASVPAFGDDISERTDPDDRVLTGHPTHVAASDALMFQNNSRIYMEGVLYDETAAGTELFTEMTAALKRGRIQYVVDVRHTRTILDHNESAKRAVETNFCEVQDPGLYHSRNVSLYRYQPDCPEGRRWTG
jgi:hypothetical protein